MFRRAAHPAVQKHCLVLLLLVILFPGPAGAAPALTGNADDKAFIQLCANGSPQEVRNALDSRADPNARWAGPSRVTAKAPQIANGDTALITAVTFNPHPDVVRALLEAGSDVNAPGSKGSTPLMRAAKGVKNPEVLTLLLEKGARLNDADDNGVTALHQAASSVGSPAFQRLLDLGADPKAVDKKGNSVLRQAARAGNGPAFDALLKTPAGQEGPALLYDAALGGNARIVESVLRAGGDPKAGNTAGDTPLHHAKTPDVATALLKAGADVNAVNAKGETPLMTLRGETGTASILLAAGADVNLRDKEGYTKLMRACAWVSRPMVELLLKSGADVNARDEAGKTPIMYSVQLSHGFSEPVSHKEALTGAYVEAGADVNARDRYGHDCLMHVGIQPRFAGEEKTQSGLARILVKAGANVHARDDQQRTALMLVGKNAAEAETVLVLVRAGSDVNAKDRTGLSVADYIRASEYEAEAKLRFLAEESKLPPEIASKRR